MLTSGKMGMGWYHLHESEDGDGMIKSFWHAWRPKPAHRDFPRTFGVVLAVLWVDPFAQWPLEESRYNKTFILQSKLERGFKGWSFPLRKLRKHHSPAATLTTAQNNLLLFAVWCDAQKSSSGWNTPRFLQLVCSNLLSQPEKWQWEKENLISPRNAVNNLYVY